MIERYWVRGIEGTHWYVVRNADGHHTVLAVTTCEESAKAAQRLMMTPVFVDGGIQIESPYPRHGCGMFPAGL